MEGGKEIQGPPGLGGDEAGRKLLLCQPQTFMNDSGEAIGALVRFYQLPMERILMAVDDADLPLGHIRLRAEGSSGGHHGLESVESSWPRGSIRGCGWASGGGRRTTGR